MPFDLRAVQQDILGTLRTDFPQFLFFRSTIPEDEKLPRAGDEVNPFFLVQFGGMTPRPRGRSIRGARNDEYYSWVQIIGVGSVEDDVADALSLVVDRMIGMRPSEATPLIPDGNSTDYGSRQYTVRPVMFYQSQRFEFNIKQNGLDGYLSD